MVRFLRIPRAAAVLAAAAMLLLAACASGPRISSEADPSADFGRYRSFAFYSPLAIESRGYSTPTSNRIRQAARAQLEARGYVYDERDPDLWVNLNAYLQERTDVSTIPEVDYDYYYSYRARSYVAVPYWRERTSVRRYTEGTLNVDLVDARQNRLVWTGVAVGQASSRSTPAERDARIDSAVAQIFARYPYRAAPR
ncbi:DUF4136 domain-containing protein [Pseudoxanthomonas sp. SGNA-20]|jgi:hypothetical protein|uniref:Uncharacterized protein DUF4136 n=1 Tax=Pseudoxanthomonas taiwanensis J19 TaxID=935569 RepID=A0A562D4W3_9GAMM|nr:MULTISPECIES: DUF4136 domain-containing protein [Pseudoxanthomonas]RRN58981.1 DUF4136 domain-containing protein [Pseudoxanthomonas sp. SGNA-20]RRN80943.1 DUF4136 domain-containing protein [Pseudoxanthomonas sp. SGD-10]TWH04775.1 uncharacterized protein DUF4136 [Pseudoxanthomonas taiwanensis J19]